MIKTIRAYSSLLVLAAAGATGLTARAEICINEIMQSNIDCILDEINEFPDSWVELYNPGNIALDLGDYSLGTSEKLKKAYKLQGVIPAGGHVLVYCDKEGKGMHASFRLESGDEGAVYLFKDGEVVEAITDIAKQPAPNVSYGRQSDGADEWGYQLIPSPGAANEAGIAQGILGEPEFSVAGGIMKSGVSLALAVPADMPAGTEIRYTFDGTEPTSESLLYSEELVINKSTVVRAKLFAQGYVSPRSTTHSYIFHPRDTELAIVSIATDPDYLYSDELGIFSHAEYKDGLMNFEHEWRRPINIEIFESVGADAVVNQLCETRVKGGKTRSFPLKSVVLYANKRFGEKRFEHVFFPDQRPDAKKFKSLELRNGGNDMRRLCLRDGYSQRLFGENVDLDWAAIRPVVVYINGKYHGFYNLRERANEDNIYTHYDGLEDVDIIENWGELKEGSMDNFNQFREFYNESGHTFEDYSQLMDINEYINHTLMYITLANVDYPGNNHIMWRPQAEDGKWRFIAKDMDLALGWDPRLLPDMKSIDFIFDGSLYQPWSWAITEWASRLMGSLLELSEFRDRFVDSYSVYAGTFLKNDYMLRLLNDMCEESKDEVIVSQLTNCTDPLDYDSEKDRIEKWIVARNEFLRTYMGEYFGVGAPVSLMINADSENISDLEFSINGIPVNGGSFDGHWYAGRRLNIEASSLCPDDALVGWEVKATLDGGDAITVYVEHPDLDFNMPKAASVELVPMMMSGVSEISGDSLNQTTVDLSDPVEVFDLTGRGFGVMNVSNLDEGVYILKQGSATMKYYRR